MKQQHDLPVNETTTCITAGLPLEDPRPSLRHFIRQTDTMTTPEAATTSTMPEATTIMSTSLRGFVLWQLRHFDLLKPQTLYLAD